MTGTGEEVAARVSGRGAISWLATRDPGFAAAKRSIRAAVVMPAVFAIAHAAFGDPQVSLFAAFGAFSMLLLVDFAGARRTRLGWYLALLGFGCVSVVVGTAASTHPAAAVVSMAAMGFVVLFGGIAAPQIAAASTAALLSFVLPVAVASPVGEIGPRLGGWVLAAACSIPACLLLWPSRWHDELREELAAALSAVGDLAAAHATGKPDAEERATTGAEVERLAEVFARTPYPPTGASARAIALSKLVGRTEWVAQNAVIGEAASHGLGREPVRKVVTAAADTLRRSASLVGTDPATRDGPSQPVATLVDSARRLEESVHGELESDVAAIIGPADGQVAGEPDLASVIAPEFHARALGIAASMVADAALESAGAEPVTGHRTIEPTDRSATLLRKRITADLSPGSVWFRNAVRGAAALALAVAVVEVTAVQHGFWVVLGTLAVLRSNALGTGSSALRAVGGTALGFVVGSALLVGIGAEPVALWVLLPLSVAVAGMAPSVISFTAGQAGFTVMVVILFNIISPSGWRVGLTRIEDVTIGCAVSVAVGLLFWPRGATAALGRALRDAFSESSAYLADAVGRLAGPDQSIDVTASARAAHRAHLRLDDAFRQFLGERGTKIVPIETVSRLMTGTNRLRLAAYALSSLPRIGVADGERELESVTVAAAVLRDAYAISHRWYEEFGELLAGLRDRLDPPTGRTDTLGRLLDEALEEARSARRRDQVRVVLRLYWADQLLESQHPVETDLLGAAALFADHRRTVLV